MGCVIELENITNALKTKDLLKRKNLRATVEKVSGSNKKGCTYRVKVAGDCEAAVELTRNAGIRISGIF